VESGVSIGLHKTLAICISLDDTMGKKTKAMGAELFIDCAAAKRN